MTATEAKMKRLVPGLILGVFLLYVAAALVAGASARDGFNFTLFGRLPVLLNGRVQPIDSVARIGLLQIRGTVTVPPEHGGGWRFWNRAPALGATEWLAELLMTPDAADTRKIFPIQDPTLLRTLHLTAAAGSAPTYVAFKDLQPSLEILGQQVARISKSKNPNRAAWERECLTLRNALVIYERLKNSLQPNSFLQREAKGAPVRYDFAALAAQYRVDLRSGVEAAIRREHGDSKQLDAATQDSMRAFAKPFASVSRVGLLSVIPPLDPASARNRWHNMGAVIVDSARSGTLPLSVAYYAAMSSAFVQGQPVAFNNQVWNYLGWLKANGLAPEVARARHEFLFSRLQPFVRAAGIYLFAFVLLCASWIRRSPLLYRSSIALVALAFVLHTGGLLFDMMLEGRPPLTNLYSMFVFAGWALVVAGGLLERTRRTGVRIAAATMSAFMAIALAHSLAPGGAVQLLRAALGPSYWLAVLATFGLLCVATGATLPGVDLPLRGRVRHLRKDTAVAVQR